MKFSQLSQYIQKIEQTSSRLEMTEYLAQIFKELSPSEFEKATYLLQGKISPRYNTINFGMAEKMVIKAIVSALQIDEREFVQTYKKLGDLGEAVQQFKEEKPSLHTKDLEIEEVFNSLLIIAQASGPGSQEKKIQELALLINNLDSLSSRYLVRIPTGTLRLGFSDMTMLDALSWMMQGDKKLRKPLQKAYHVHPDLGYIGKILKQKGIQEVEKIEPAIFTPILMMRAERLSSGEEIIEKIGKCSIEPKYDGFRLQVHKKGDEVRLFTRGLEDATFMYPDVVAGVQKEVIADEVILEGEAIGYDVQTNNFMPFQETVQRKRKYDIEEKAKEVPLKLFAFELLYLNGKNYVHTEFSQRRKELENIVKNNDDVTQDTVIVANDEVTDDPKRIELLFEDAITRGLEGLIAKKLDGTYQPGARGSNWIKFKRSYSSKIDDTVDCLVMGYDYGKGKRSAFGIGAFLVGVYNSASDEYVTLAKIGTGLSDEQWIELKAKIAKLESEKKPARYNVDKLMDCDAWVNPEIVVEIKADELTRSPVHTAGRKLKPSKSGSSTEIDVAGFALRFPRLVRFREDKSPEEVTTLEEINKMYKKQTG